MKLPRRNFLYLAAGAAALPGLSRFAWAQGYPTRPVRIIVGYPAGGTADVVARLIGQQLSSASANLSSSRTDRAPAPTSLPRQSRSRRQTGTHSSWLTRRLRSTRRSTTTSISLFSATSRQLLALLASRFSWWSIQRFQ